MDEVQREIGDEVAAAVLDAIDKAPDEQRQQLLAAVKAGDVKVRPDGNVRVVFVGGVEVYRFTLGRVVALDEPEVVN